MKTNRTLTPLQFLQSDNALLILLALVSLTLHLATSGGFGYFRDEFYYMAAGRNLDFGYVEFPPFVALVAAFTRVTIGESLLTLRFFPAISGALLVLVTGLITRALGGGRTAQGMAALAALAAPGFLGASGTLTMDVFDQLFWAGCLYFLVRILCEGNPRLWLPFGLVAGVGLTNKVTMLNLGLAVAVGLLLGGRREQFRRKELYLGGLIALVFLLPYIGWNAAHGWPTVEFWGNYHNLLNPVSPIEYILQQIQTMNPGLFPIWLAGLVYTFTASGKRFRPIGVSYIFLLVILMIQQAKFYFLSPYYSVLFALGAYALVNKLLPGVWKKFGPNWVRWTAAVTVLFLPLFMTALPDPLELRYLSVFSFLYPKAGSYDVAPLPQYFADRFGWPEMTDTVAQVYENLPPADKAKACIFAQNYGEAGAIAFFGEKRGLPPVISGNNNYYIWGTRGCTGEVMIVLGGLRKDLEALFEQVEQPAATSPCPHCMPQEQNLPVFVARGMRMPLSEIWPGVKIFQ